MSLGSLASSQVLLTRLLFFQTPSGLYEDLVVESVPATDIFQYLVQVTTTTINSPFWGHSKKLRYLLLILSLSN